MKVTDVSMLPVSPNPHHVDARIAYNSPPVIAMVITLRPGEALKEHTTPVDVFFYVLEGIGCAEIGDERTTVGKDMLIECPARIPHRWANESTGLFRLLAVKIFRPAGET
jgi:quercetin dioxygenase-like cupin family protein